MRGIAAWAIREAAEAVAEWAADRVDRWRRARAESRARANETQPQTQARHEGEDDDYYAEHPKAKR